MTRFTDDEYVAPAVPVRTVEDVVVTRESSEVVQTPSPLMWPILGTLLVLALIVGLVLWANDNDDTNTVVPVQQPSPGSTVFINPGTPYPAPPQQQPAPPVVNNNYFAPPAQPSAQSSGS